MNFDIDSLTDAEIEAKEEELFIEDILSERLLEEWRKGLIGDSWLLDRLRGIKEIASNSAATQLLDELRRS